MSRFLITTTALLAVASLAAIAAAAPMPQGSFTPTTTSAPAASSSSNGTKKGRALFWGIFALIMVSTQRVRTDGQVVAGAILAWPLYLLGKVAFWGVLTLLAVVGTGAVRAFRAVAEASKRAAASARRGTAAANSWAKGRAAAMRRSRRSRPKSPVDSEKGAAEAASEKKLAEVLDEHDSKSECSDRASTISVAAPAYAEGGRAPSYYSSSDESAPTSGAV
ncbi:hypothetical protein Q8F55_006168 [Vanrija albida]|uniref:Uncharacterized protein n=1 Tax=Vanrija albida TaxID=181172 RepID=A0ABR3PWF8_9TREE